ALYQRGGEKRGEEIACPRGTAGTPGSQDHPSGPWLECQALNDPGRRVLELPPGYFNRRWPKPAGGRDNAFDRRRRAPYQMLQFKLVRRNNIRQWDKGFTKQCAQVFIYVEAEIGVAHDRI